ncbi:hypothetical protein B0H19DRAFT_1378889 [Mycena capillaripes]|nr:hypothetical protein B0H19DRAFT_1378889 [Mycena capillaripes]
MPSYPCDTQTQQSASSTLDTTGYTQPELDVTLRPRSTAGLLSFPTNDFSAFNLDTPCRDRPPPSELDNFTTSHLRAAEKQFDTANEHASIVLAVNQDRADARDTTRPFSGAAVNLPHGPLPSLHARIPATDDVRKATGKKRGRDGAEKENEGNKADAGGGKRIQFSANDLIHIARVAVDVKPFLAEHKSKGTTWQLLKDTLVQEGFPHRSVRTDTIQHKVEGLVAFKKDPSKNKKLANLIGEGTSAGITIAALLERLEDQHDQGKDKSDEAKAKIKKKSDEDHMAGEAIRSASMKTLRTRTHTHGDDDGDITDTESADTPWRRPIASSSSIETVDSDDSDAANKRKTKRRRRNPGADTEALLALMKAENERRAKHDARIADAFDTFVGNNSRQKDEYIGLLRDLLAKDA